ncbi:MAG: DUF2891 domain-containing protein [Bryobacterales bacterium]|nr:DUF2891 domain-containing protein [Bryobacterales bacterium]
MTRPAVLLFLIAGMMHASQDFDEAAGRRFAALALECVHKEYPNKIAHAMESDADAKPPRELTPAFYGCYDWHSAVHGHWLLARLARTFPKADFAPAARAALQKSLTAANLQQEVRYLNATGRATFERPYGLAWLMQLSAELMEWDDPQARQWAAHLEPLVQASVARVIAWLPKLSYPIRTGEHNNTAFSLGLMLDSARSAKNAPFEALLTARIRDYYLKDKACPLAYEPSGEDFLSPCLAEADAVRRVLPPAEFAMWFRAFLPKVDLTPTVVTDFTDGKLYHLAGLNLSRAWMLDGILSRLPTEDPRLRRLALDLRQAGLAAVTAAHYEGGHWLGSFAVYLVSGRGLPPIH